MKPKVKLVDYDFGTVKVTRTDDETELPNFKSSRFKQVDVEFEFHLGNANVENTVGVVYSGGWDSTLLMLRNIEAQRFVQPILFDYPNDNAIREIGLKILGAKCGRFILPPISISPLTIGGNVENNCCGQQAYIHFMLGFLPVDLLPMLSEIQVGYVMNDDAISFLDELRSLTKTHFAIQHKLNVPVTYPLTKISRGEVHAEVKQKLGDFCTCISCENPEIKFYKKGDDLFMLMEACGGCSSCRKDKMHIDFTKFMCVKIPHL